MQRAVYMDWNATAPVRPEAARAVMSALEACGNPSSVHGFGRNARKLMEEARVKLASRVGAKMENVIFTSGGTEANMLALASRGARRLVVSAIEHDSVLKPAIAAGAAVAKVDSHGVVNRDHLRSLLKQDARPALISLMLANNETGVLQPVADAAEMAHAHGALLHCDAAQALGRINVQISDLGADLLTVSGHKFGAPQGVGALITNGTPVSALLLGGGQERSRRAGTENVPAIAGLGAAVAAIDLAASANIARLREALERRLLDWDPAVTVFGRDVARLPNTLCFAAGGKPAETLVMALDLAGIAVSAGSACSSGKVRPSHVVTAMGFDATQAATALRVSLGETNTESDIDAFMAAWKRIQAPVATQIQPAA
ncbi:cysteine desulfurase family protein [Dongia sp.]|uniref:cysteine desulfurase family protein n=1 Tax=Dongia sp. TaxID=1977262 RepID=UPI0037537746